MSGRILVRPDPYFAITDDSGKFEIRNLPAGELEFQAWHESVGGLGLNQPDLKWDFKGRFTITLKNGEEKDLKDISVPAAAVPRPLAYDEPGDEHETDVSGVFRLSPASRCSVRNADRLRPVGRGISSRHDRDEEGQGLSEQQQQIADILTAMFGTPDEPFVLPQTGLDLEKITLASGPVNPATGRARGLFREHCMHCHGITGDDAGPTAVFLDPYPRDYRRGWSNTNRRGTTTGRRRTISCGS